MPFTSMRSQTQNKRNVVCFQVRNFIERYITALFEWFPHQEDWKQQNFFLKNLCLNVQNMNQNVNVQNINNRHFQPASLEIYPNEIKCAKKEPTVSINL